MDSYWFTASVGWSFFLLFSIFTDTKLDKIAIRDALIPPPTKHARCLANAEAVVEQKGHSSTGLTDSKITRAPT